MLKYNTYGNVNNQSLQNRYMALKVGSMRRLSSSAYDSALSRLTDYYASVHKSDDPDALRGAERAAKDCSGKSPGKLMFMLVLARHEADQAENENKDAVAARAYAHGLEWLCAAISVWLKRQGEPEILSPTPEMYAEVLRVIDAERAANG